MKGEENWLKFINTEKHYKSFLRKQCEFMLIKVGGVENKEFNE